MLSSINSLSGLSATNLLLLFGDDSASSSGGASTRPAKSTSSAISSSGANDPASAIKAILAQAQIEQTQTGMLGGASSVSASAAYSVQFGGSSALVSASVTVSSPDAMKQIGDAVSEINSAQIMVQTNVDPATHNGISGYVDPLTVTAVDAVNISVSNGAISATAMQGASFPDGLPSLTAIQQAYNNILEQDQPNSPSAGVPATFNGNFTLVKLPPGTLGAGGPNFTVFSADGYWSDDNMWALVLTQNSVSVTASETQIAS